MRRVKHWYHLSLLDLFWIVGFFSIQFALLTLLDENAVLTILGLTTFYFVTGALIATLRMRATRNQSAVFAWLCGTFGSGLTLTLRSTFGFLFLGLDEETGERLSLFDAALLSLLFGILVGGFLSTIWTAFYYVLQWSFDAIQACDATMGEPPPLTTVNTEVTRRFTEE